MFSWVELHLNSLSALHLKGGLNVLSDFLSRHWVKQDEWVLNQEVYLDLVVRWGTPEVDLFASRSNVKVPHFCSLVRGDQAWALYALSVP